MRAIIEQFRLLPETIKLTEIERHQRHLKGFMAPVVWAEANKGYPAPTDAENVEIERQIDEAVDGLLQNNADYMTRSAYIQMQVVDQMTRVFNPLISRGSLGTKIHLLALKARELGDFDTDKAAECVAQLMRYRVNMAFDEAMLCTGATQPTECEFAIFSEIFKSELKNIKEKNLQEVLKYVK